MRQQFWTRPVGVDQPPSTLLTRLRTRMRRLSLARRFMIASLLTLVSGMAGIGWWLGRQIEEGVVNRTAATTALYVDSFISPLVMVLVAQPTSSPEHSAALGQLLRETPLGQQIAAFKIWAPGGRILYSANPGSVGQVFPIEGNLARALDGAVAARISELEAAENVLERGTNARLLEIYSPVREHNTGRVIAVAEFYQRIDDLQHEVATAQRRSWLLVATITLGMYVLLAGFIGRASTTITHQQSELSDQVARLTELLQQNQVLHERVRRAAARTTALNERYLRRISADLHDGPAQDLGLALLHLDAVATRHQACTCTPGSEQARQNLDIIAASLSRAMQEIRAISAGLSLPQLTSLSLAETLRRVVRTHERRTGTVVALHSDISVDDASLPVKITVYRFVQEALQNAYRHAGGVGQEVRAASSGEQLSVEVTDRGPGISDGSLSDNEQHLGLVGLRERVESLGGTFSIESRPGHGTTVGAQIALHAEEHMA